MALSDLTRELEELIVALDRRAPRAESEGETAIAREAAALRGRAVDRLAEITRQIRVSAATRRTESS